MSEETQPITPAELLAGINGHVLALQEARDHIESLKAQISMMAEIIDRLTAQEEEEAELKRRHL